MTKTCNCVTSCDRCDRTIAENIKAAEMRLDYFTSPELPNGCFNPRYLCDLCEADVTPLVVDAWRAVTSKVPMRDRTKAEVKEARRKAREEKVGCAFAVLFVCAVASTVVFWLLSATYATQNRELKKQLEALTQLERAGEANHE